MGFQEFRRELACADNWGRFFLWQAAEAGAQARGQTGVRDQTPRKGRQRAAGEYAGEQPQGEVRFPHVAVDRNGSLPHPRGPAAKAPRRQRGGGRGRARPAEVPPESPVVLPRASLHRFSTAKGARGRLRKNGPARRPTARVVCPEAPPGRVQPGSGPAHRPFQPSAHRPRNQTGGRRCR